MANPAVFTTSDIGGGSPYTRLRGPLRMGYSTADPGSQTISATVNPAGSAAAPMYSFITLPNAGLYGSVLTTSAAELRMSIQAQDIAAWTTAGLGPIVSTGGFFSTVGTSVGLYIPQSTGTLVSSSAGTTGVSMNGNALLVWDSANKRLQVFSTVAGEWLRQPSASAFTSS